VLDSKGNLWVADHGNDHVEEFSEQGGYRQQFGSVGSGNGQLREPDALAFGAIGAKEGQFSTPEGIAIDSHGDVWVSDTGNGRLQELDERANS